MKIGMKAPTVRMPCLLNGKLNFLPLSEFQGNTLALCCVSSLTETEAWVLDAQVKRFQECGTVLAVFVSGDFAFETTWICSPYNFCLPLLADPIKRVSRALRLSRSLPPQRCETLFFDDQSRLQFRLIHDLNLRGISTVLDIPESEFCQRSSHRLDSACHSNSLQRESNILALSTTEPHDSPGSSRNQTHQAPLHEGVTSS